MKLYIYWPHDLNKNDRNQGCFEGVFFGCYLVVKTQPSIEFQNSIFHLFHFKNLHFILIFEVLFLIHFPLAEHFRKKYIFSILLLSKCVFQQSSRFEFEKFTACHEPP